jgi:anti-anti-sigma factor
VIQTTDDFEMTVVHSAGGAAAVIELRGEFDLCAAEVFRDRIDDLLSWDVPAFHISCSGLTFVDSAGLQSLLRAARAAKAQDVGFVVVSMSDRLRDLLSITATTELLPTA